MKTIKLNGWLRTAEDTYMTNEELRQFLASRDACQSAMDWLEDRDSSQMWAECERPDWLLWWAAHAVPRQDLVRAACDCAETARRFVPEGEDRPLRAIDAARRWARGEATLDEVRAAARAARSACTANAAWAADAAAHSAYAAEAAEAAHAAADATAYATSAAWDADAARGARAAYATMCELIRQRWPECPLPEVAA